MRVLLTGGAGYIGSHTCVALLKAGHDIVVADDYSNSKPESLRRVTALTGRTFPAYALNLCDQSAVNALFEREKIDAVIHFAGLKAVGESVEKPLLYYRVNLDASLTLAEAMRRFGVSKLVFSSSATVYGNIASPIGEDAQLGAASPYGWTKLMIEQIFKDTAAAHPHWSVALLRYFNPVGAHPSGLIGENPRGVPNNLMPRAVAAACHGDVLTVFGDDYPTPDGTNVRDYIHVMDLAHGHLRALEYLSDHTGVEAFNLGTGVGVSVMEIIRAVESASGMRVNYVVGPRRPGDAPSYYADAQKAGRLLGWRAEKTLRDMCVDAWRFQKNNPDGYAEA